MSFQGLRVLTESDWMERFTAKVNCQMNCQLVTQGLMMLIVYRGSVEERGRKPVDANPIMLRTSDAPLAFQQWYSFCEILGGRISK
jgi:hypothetical protein